MKKETVKEMLEKMKEKLNVRKKDVVPAAMAMMALAAIIGLTVHAYQTELFSKGSVVAAEKNADTEKEEPVGENQTKVRAKESDKTGTGSVANTPDPVKESNTSAEEKETEESKKEAKTTEKKPPGDSGRAENEAAQIGSSEKGSSKSASGTGRESKAQTPAVSDTPEPTAVPAAAEQPAVPASAPIQNAEPQQPASVQESAPVPELVHEHIWVPITVTIHHDAVTHVVHHDAVTQTVHHDAVTHEEPVYDFRTICNTCGADITGHIPDHIGSVCLGTYGVQQVQTGVNVVTDQEAYDEEVVVQEAWDETVTDQAAYDDVVTTGYRCSTCGVTRQ